MTSELSIEPLSEDALLLRFGDGIDIATNARVHAAARALRAAALPGIIDIAPAHATLLVRFEMVSGSFSPIDALRKAIEGPDTAVENDPDTISRCFEVPVCYGDDWGPDLADITAQTRIAPDEFIARHTAAEYTVAMLGFAPGFPYLIGLDPALHVARRANPRTRVPAGSVAIGGAQTGIYPRELPGGWWLIGRTPRVLFDPARDPPCLFAPGERVRFRAIRADEFIALSEKPDPGREHPTARDQR